MKFMEKLVVCLRIVGSIALLHGDVLLFMKTTIGEDCTGISGKSQILFLIANVGKVITLMLQGDWFSFALFFETIFIIYTLIILSAIYYFHESTYQRQYDVFDMYLILPVCLLATLAVHTVSGCQYGFFDTFCNYLEAMAIVPQLFFAMQANKIEIDVYHYVVLVTTYKSIYITVNVLESLDNVGSLIAGIGGLLPCLYFFTKSLPTMYPTLSSLVKEEHSSLVTL